MNNMTFPEDSVLSRHFSTTVELKRETWLRSLPSDSTLRRHALTSNRYSQPHASDTQSVAPSSTLAFVSTTEASSRQVMSEEKGFFTWLFQLFSR
jgi:hypothetical protein